MDHALGTRGQRPSGTVSLNPEWDADHPPHATELVAYADLARLRRSCDSDSPDPAAYGPEALLSVTGWDADHPPHAAGYAPTLLLAP